MTTKGNDQPATLFKYRPMQSAKRLLSEGRIAWAAPRTLNDTFDIHTDPLWNAKLRGEQERAAALMHDTLAGDYAVPDNASSVASVFIQRHAASLARLSPRIRPHFARHSLALWGDMVNGTMQQWHAEFARQVRQFRVLCLSADGYSVPMWTHYSDNHTGVAIGFDAAVLRHHWRAKLLHVSYQSEPVEFMSADAWRQSLLFGVPIPMSLQDTRNPWVFTKHQSWAHEQEWRFACVDDNPNAEDVLLVDLPPDCVRSLVVGYKTPRDAVLDEVAKLAERFSRDLRVIELCPQAKDDLDSPAVTQRLAARSVTLPQAIFSTEPSLPEEILGQIPKLSSQLGPVEY